MKQSGRGPMAGLITFGSEDFPLRSGDIRHRRDSEDAQPKILTLRNWKLH